MPLHLFVSAKLRLHGDTSRLEIHLALLDPNIILFVQDDVILMSHVTQRGNHDLINNKNDSEPDTHRRVQSR